jgi:hypothetical protein
MSLYSFNSYSLKLFFPTLLAICAPFFLDTSIFFQPSSSHFLGWPTHYEKKSLKRLKLTEKEKGFLNAFPGKIARFTDGRRELIIRWIEEPTRRLHPASDCFKGMGYTIVPQAIQRNKKDIKMGCFTAKKENNVLNICEYIEGSNGSNWSDISAWYWGAVFEQSPKGWMSYVIAENKNDES